jgi:hypothetical protein
MIMKTESLGSIKNFMSGEWKQKKTLSFGTKAKLYASACGTTATLILSDTAFAASTDDSFDNILTTVMNLFDKGVVLVIIFAGASWGMGHRGKALEILIGVCCGYLLARHAVDIQQALKKL